MKRPTSARAALPGLSLLLGLSALIFPACAQGIGSDEGCLQGQTTCGGICVNTLADPAHCGGCGSACADGEVCEAGGCVAECTAGLASCAGGCVDLEDDIANCGSCNVACPGGTRCEGGACVAGCGEGLTHCGPSCVDVATDAAHCGACGQACGVNQICEGGACVLSCGEGLSLCSGQCVDTQTSPQHCGGCGLSCAPGNACQGGMCEGGCSPGQCGFCAQNIGSAVPQSVPGNTAGQSDLHQPGCGGFGTPEAAFTFTAPAFGTYSFSTSGSSFDPVLAVIDSAGCFELDCNDDSNGFESRVDVSLGSGQSVVVVVEDLGGSTGTFTLSVTQGGGGGGMCDGTGDCQFCLDCSLQGPCVNEFNACVNEPACVDVDACIQNCFDQACIDACVQQSPVGGPLYAALVDCVFCDACAFDCAGQASCP